MNQPSLFEARKARDEGIAKTSSKNSAWLADAMERLSRMSLEHSEVTGEEMRVWLTANGLPAPTSPHAWGALTQHAVRCGILVDTGRVKQMWTEKSHARRTPVWRFRA